MLKSRVFGLFLLKKDDTCYNMFMFRSGAATVILIGATVTIGLILTGTYVFADDSVDDVAITVPVSCTLSGTGMNTHNATINNGQYNSAIGQTTIKALCNDSEGFAIYTIGYTDNTDGVNVLTDSTLGSTFDITTGTQTSGNSSKWAMKLTADSGQTYPIVIENSFNNFHNVPDDYTLAASRASGTDVGTSAVGSTIATTYQAYISPTQAAGTYTGQVKYTLVHPSSADAPLKPNQVAVVFHGNGYTLNGGATENRMVFGLQNNFFTVASGTYAQPIGSNDEWWAISPVEAGYSLYGAQGTNGVIGYLEVLQSYGLVPFGDTIDLYANNPYTINYNGNGATAGTMSGFETEVEANVSELHVTLFAPNFEKTGYGFAGWSTDSNAIVNGSSKIYGPNETITGDELTFDPSTRDTTLYAVWVPVARTSGNAELTFQTTNLFTTTLSDNTTLISKPAGYVTALKDVRDNEVYAITKVSDGSWWMIENLRLDLGTANITAANTNNPKASFLSEITNASSSSVWCEDIYDASCTDVVRYNTSNLNRSLPAAPGNYNDQIMWIGDTQWYSYGIYYNWYTATAGYGTQEVESGWDDEIGSRIAPSMDGDICPSGWRLPVAKNINSGEFDSAIPGSLYSLIGIWGGSGGQLDDSEIFANYPFNYVYSGEFSGSGSRQGGRWFDGGDASSSYNGSTFGYSGYEETGLYISVSKHWTNIKSASVNDSGSRVNGAPVRCVAVP